MRTTVIAVAFVVLAASSLLSAASAALVQRIEDAATVLTEIHAVPEKDIPKDLWDKAACIMVVPGLKKAAFIFGGEYGKGLMSCRANHAWTSPVVMRVEKGSWGLQIGAQSIDLVLLVMNQRGAEKLLGNKVSLGAEISVAAGPVGRDARAATDVQLAAEILSYSRTQGLFAGVNLSGGVIRGSQDDNRDLYGSAVVPRDVLKGGHSAPDAVKPLMDALDREF